MPICAANTGRTPLGIDELRPRLAWWEMGLLEPGENMIGALLGDGWYCGHVGFQGRQRYGERNATQAIYALEAGEYTFVVK